MNCWAKFKRSLLALLVLSCFFVSSVIAENSSSSADAPIFQQFSSLGSINSESLVIPWPVDSTFSAEDQASFDASWQRFKATYSVAGSYYDLAQSLRIDAPANSSIDFSSDLARKNFFAFLAQLEKVCSLFQSYSSQIMQNGNSSSDSVLGYINAALRIMGYSLALSNCPATVSLDFLNAIKYFASIKYFILNESNTRTYMINKMNSDERVAVKMGNPSQAFSSLISNVIRPTFSQDPEKTVSAFWAKDGVALSSKDNLLQSWQTFVGDIRLRSVRQLVQQIMAKSGQRAFDGMNNNSSVFSSLDTNNLAVINFEYPEVCTLLTSYLSKLQNFVQSFLALSASDQAALKNISQEMMGLLKDIDVIFAYNLMSIPLFDADGQRIPERRLAWKAAFVTIPHLIDSLAKGYILQVENLSLDPIQTLGILKKVTVNKSRSLQVFWQQDNSINGPYSYAEEWKKFVAPSSLARKMYEAARPLSNWIPQPLPNEARAYLDLSKQNVFNVFVLILAKLQAFIEQKELAAVNALLIDGLNDSPTTLYGYVSLVRRIIKLNLNEWSSASTPKSQLNVALAAYESNIKTLSNMDNSLSFAFEKPLYNAEGQLSLVLENMTLGPTDAEVQDQANRKAQEEALKAQKAADEEARRKAEQQQQQEAQDRNRISQQQSPIIQALVSSVLNSPMPQQREAQFARIKQQITAGFVSDASAANDLMEQIKNLADSFNKVDGKTLDEVISMSQSLNEQISRLTQIESSAKQNEKAGIKATPPSPKVDSPQITTPSIQVEPVAIENKSSERKEAISKLINDNVIQPSQELKRKELMESIESYSDLDDRSAALETVSSVRAAVDYLKGLLNKEDPTEADVIEVNSKVSALAQHVNNLEKIKNTYQERKSREQQEQKLAEEARQKALQARKSRISDLMAAVSKEPDFSNRQSLIKQLDSAPDLDNKNTVVEAIQIIRKIEEYFRGLSSKNEPSEGDLIEADNQLRSLSAYAAGLEKEYSSYQEKKAREQLEQKLAEEARQKALQTRKNRISDLMAAVSKEPDFPNRQSLIKQLESAPDLDNKNTVAEIIQNIRKIEEYFRGLSGKDEPSDADLVEAGNQVEALRLHSANLEKMNSAYQAKKLEEENNRKAAEEAKKTIPMVVATVQPVVNKTVEASPVVVAAPNVVATPAPVVSAPAVNLASVANNSVGPRKSYWNAELAKSITDAASFKAAWESATAPNGFMIEMYNLANELAADQKSKGFFNVTRKSLFDFNDPKNADKLLNFVGTLFVFASNVFKFGDAAAKSLVGKSSAVFSYVSLAKSMLVYSSFLGKLSLNKNKTNVFGSEIYSVEKQKMLSQLSDFVGKFYDLIYSGEMPKVSIPEIIAPIN